jgi:hypothetical protein
MRAVIRPSQIDFLGASHLSKEEWESLLDELKTVEVPSLTPKGKRMLVVLNPDGRIDTFVYRTSQVPDKDIIRILAKYGIPASVEPEDAI